ARGTLRIKTRKPAAMRVQKCVAPKPKLTEVFGLVMQVNALGRIGQLELAPVRQSLAPQNSMKLAKSLARGVGILASGSVRTEVKVDIDSELCFGCAHARRVLDRSDIR